jgi:hypothetical protein
MADNRDPRKKSRTRRQLRTSSSGRSARSKASAKDTPRPTSSTDRARQQGKGSSKVTTGKGGVKENNVRPVKGTSVRSAQSKRGDVIRAFSKNNEQAGKIRKDLTKIENRQSSNPGPNIEREARRGDPKNKIVKGPKKPIQKPVSPNRGAQGPRTPPVQGPSRRVSGIIGTRQGSTSTPRKTPPTPGTKLGKPKTTVKPTTKGNKGGSSALKTTLAAGMVTALATGSLRNPVTAAKQRESKENRKKITKKSTDKYNTQDADGTVRSRLKVGPKKVGPGKVGTVAQAFDKAYAAAKKDKKKEFTFKGKKYSTK